MSSKLSGGLVSRKKQTSEHPQDCFSFFGSTLHGRQLDLGQLLRLLGRRGYFCADSTRERGCHAVTVARFCFTFVTALPKGIRSGSGSGPGLPVNVMTVGPFTRER